MKTVMTKEQINERIAKLCGPNQMVGLKKRGLWYRHEASGYTSCECEAGMFTRDEAKKHEYHYDEPVTIHEFSPRDYVGSLDACREFELFTTNSELKAYGDALIDVLKCDVDSYNPIVASSRDRCEAFLRMKGQWVE